MIFVDYIVFANQPISKAFKSNYNSLHFLFFFHFGVKMTWEVSDRWKKNFFSEPQSKLWLLCFCN